MGAGPSVKPAKLAQAARLRKRRQQVAAVCYRIRKRGVEFLLVQTRSGRWIFPKGGVEPGLTHAQSAALEAFEEAGVHGRMEEIPFARYFRRKPAPVTSGESSQSELAVTAYLCEVSHLEPPQELNRNPTWFSAEKVKARLLKNRTPEFGAELVRVVDRAVSRIQRLRGGAHDTRRRTAKGSGQKDALQEVRFEALADGRLRHLSEALIARNILHRHDGTGSVSSSAPTSASRLAIELAVQAHLRKLHQIGSPDGTRRVVPQLGAGTDSAAATGPNITAIDSRGRANLPNSGNFPANNRRAQKS